MAEELIRNEVVHEDSETKTVYHVKDNELELDFLSKEVFKKEDKIIVYPFLIRNEEWRQKYPNIKKILFEGFKGRLPPGTRPTFKTGYGFTTQLNYIIYFLEKNFLDINQVIVSKNKKTKIEQSSFTINAKELESIRKQLSTEYGNLREQRRCIINNYFVSLKPDKFILEKPDYKKGTFFNILKNRLNTIKKLSSEDREALYELFKKLAFLKREDMSTEAIITTKKIVDNILIEEVITEFKKYLNAKRRNEDKWQEFFRKNAWIFSQIFAYPTVLFEDEAYVGGKRIDNRNAKAADFLYQNKISKNIAIIEIKTHLSKLIKKKPYRGDDVFEIEKELNGAINQVLNQRDNLEKEYHKLRSESEKEFYSFSPKCFVIIGKLAELDKKQTKSFELFRNSCKDVEIITFDELFERIDMLLKIFEKNKDESNSKK